MKLSGNRLVILTCAFASTFGFFITYSMLKEIKIFNLSDSLDTNVTSTSLSSKISIIKMKSFLMDTIEMCSQPSFIRFIIMNVFLIGLNNVFIQFDATFPTYLEREFGEEVPKGTIFALNPFIIVFLTPIVSLVTTDCKHYDMIKLGSYFSAISLFFVVFSTSIWSAVCMVVIYSIGDIM